MEGLDLCPQCGRLCWYTQWGRAHDCTGRITLETVAAVHRDAAAMRAIVAALAATDPAEGGGPVDDWRCRYCGATESGADPADMEHDATCVWRRATEAVGR